MELHLPRGWRDSACAAWSRRQRTGITRRGAAATWVERAIRWTAGIALSILVGSAASAGAADPHPLRSVDTSSPRSTLQSFVESIDSTYVGVTELVNTIATSDRLFLSATERRTHAENVRAAMKALRSLDLSRTPPALVNTVPIERALQLKEVLDRIDLPSYRDIPDREAMARTSSKRWRLPNTEIDIVLVEDGPRSGEFLVSADTVDRLPEFYERVRALPYKPGPAEALSEAYRSLSAGRTDTIYQAYLSSPVGLWSIVPPRWMLQLPGWATARIADVAAWQWLGLALGLLVGALFVYKIDRLGGRLAHRKRDEAAPSWHALMTPLSIIIVAALWLPALSTVLHIGGGPRIVFAAVETVAFFLGAAWLAMIASTVLADAILASRHVRRQSLDGQLVRLSMRFAGLAVAIGFLIECANELGFPAYSVLAGLGIGGLAVALAARDSLANLLGSVLIMFEKPFRVGHWIKVGEMEGMVEDVGFRSTRIRTADSSLISVPNNELVNAKVENRSLRIRRRQRFVMKLAYDTPRDMVGEVIAGTRKLLAEEPMTKEDDFHVSVSGFGGSGVDVLVNYHLRADDDFTEHRERERILLKILDLCKSLDVKLAG